MTTFSTGILSGFIETTDDWLRELREELGWASERGAYLALRGTLHALRDRLRVEEAARLGRHLPVVIRGIYYEGWNPSREAPEGEALAEIDCACRSELGPETEQATCAVLRVLSRRLKTDAVEALRKNLPPELEELWP